MHQMAALTHGTFVEKLSPFLAEQLMLARRSPEGARTQEVLERQYLHTSLEQTVLSSEVSRHYQAMIPGIPGAERIYRSTILIEPTTTCAAHCRWCLRAQYAPLQLSENQIDAFARFCGDPARSSELREVLVTGGDPLLVPKKLELLFERLSECAPNIRTYRVGTRLPLQAPDRIDAGLIRVFQRFSDSIEVGLHVNHSIELFPEVVRALKQIQATGTRIYNHTVLLRGVNDTPAELIDLCEHLRFLAIENHYLFHCVPMMGMSHHRTSVARGLTLACQLANSGQISGRSRPVFALLTAVGKVVPYEGTIVLREGSRLLLKTEFTVDERKRWNPSWVLPSASFAGDDGRLFVWYEDADDEA